MELIVGWVVETLTVDVCVLHVRQPETGKLDPLAIKGQSQVTAAWPGLTQLVVKEGGPVRLEYPWSHPRNRPSSGDRIGPFRAYLGVPIIRFREILGVLEILRLAEHPFDDNDSALVSTLAVQLGVMFAQSSPGPERCNSKQQLYVGTPAAPGIA
ncbi:MAG: GAF domain-containing protein, partial [Propionibacteriaceae bacterium]|nr:GAF domain-containing protein [Propionibacteriaceae bacterium]